jgi:hypothetical protein
MRAALAANAGLVIAGMVSFVLLGAGQSIYGPALPAFGRAFGIDTGAAGLLIPAHWVGSATGVAAMYLRGDSIVPRHALAPVALGTTLVAAGPGFEMTLAGALIFGIGNGMSTVIYNRRILALFADRGPAMLALLNAIFGIGAIGAPLVFVALGSSPAVAFGGVAVLAALTFLAAGGIGPIEGPPAVAGGFRPHWPALALGAAGVGIEACLVGLAPLALIAQGLGEAAAARFLSAFFATFLVARLLLVAAAHLIAPGTLYLGAMVAAGLLTAAQVLTGWPWFFVLSGAAAGLFFPAFYVAATRAMGDDPRVAPTIIAAGLAGGILAPLALGRLMAAAGDGVFFPVLLAAMAAAAGLALAARGRLAAAAA